MTISVEEVIAVYSEESFQKMLRDVEGEIFRRLTETIESLFCDRDELKRVVIEHRIKSSDSLREKMKRKGYIDGWRLDDGFSRDYIACRLLETVPDLIGIRLNCLFVEDEGDLLKGLLSSSCDSLSFEDDSTDTKVTKHRVYKLNGKYVVGENAYRFEVQVKSYIDNLWGEVDHKRFYKSRGYVLQRPLVVETMRQARSILVATDQQLKAIYHSSVSEDDLLKGMFFEKTKDAVSEASGEQLLGVHYESFYELLLSSQHDNLYEALARYVHQNEYSREPYRGLPETDSRLALRDLVASIIPKRYVGYNLRMLRCIASELFDYSTEAEFVQHLAELVLNRYYPGDAETLVGGAAEDFSEFDPSDDGDDGICLEEDDDPTGQETKEENLFISQ